LVSAASRLAGLLETAGADRVSRTSLGPACLAGGWPVDGGAVTAVETTSGGAFVLPGGARKAGGGGTGAAFAVTASTGLGGTAV
jgi:hypothetical protein